MAGIRYKEINARFRSRCLPPVLNSEDLLRLFVLGVCREAPHSRRQPQSRAPFTCLRNLAKPFFFLTFFFSPISSIFTLTEVYEHPLRTSLCACAYKSSGASGILFRLRTSETTEPRTVVAASSRARIGVNRPAPTSVMWSPPLYANTAIVYYRLI